ncbi:MAG TPA: ATP-grasp domain-containing protein, partial [Nitrospirae bacterium]|nr:ATP-grasp domain-containing protein [Nitrospirota bacterium]
MSATYQEPVRVLISGAGTATCQGVVKALRLVNDSHPTKIHVMDMEPLSAGRFMADRFHLVPRAEDPGFFEAVCSIVKSQKIELLIPIVDYEFGALAEGTDHLATLGCEVAIAPPDAVRRCLDKIRTRQLFLECGLATPPTIPLERYAEWSEGFPVIVKPIEGRGSVDVNRLENGSEVARLNDARPAGTMLLQNYVEGREVTVDFITDRAGQLLGYVPRYRLEVKSGVSYKGKTLHNQAIGEAVAKIVAALDYRGPGNLQYMETDQDPVFIEINP